MTEPEPTYRIADRLTAARRERFVGRIAELAMFRGLLSSPEPSWIAVHLHGPGGVGKTTLLREYAQLASECNRTAIYLDGRNIDPTPVGFLFALRQAQGLDASQEMLDSLPDGVLLLDTYETLQPIDQWLREILLPQLPAQTLVVIAGRNPPSPGWRTDLGWGELTNVLPLRNLSPEESQAYLKLHGIPEVHHEAVLARTHGHPLALSLVASAVERGDNFAAVNLEHSPDSIRILLERFVQETPSPAHQTAIEVSVLAWATTESLLAETLGEDDAHALFAWLRQLPFMEHGPHGIFPHDLVREVLEADFRWRDPAGYRRLNQRLISCLHARFAQARGLEQQRVWFDLLYISRQSPAMAPYFAWSALGGAYAEPASLTDHPAILAMVQRHQGEESARVARHWLDRMPHAFLVYREIAGDIFGFMAHLPLHEATQNDSAADPAVSAAMAFVAQHGPTRPGEEMLYLRFWMHRDAYQAVSPALNLTAINCSIHWTTRPKLAWNFLAIADPDFLEPHFTGIHMWRSPDADFSVGDHRYGVFTHDWRVEPAAAWLNIKAELTGDAEPAAAPPSASPSPRLLVLSETMFADAVRQALRDYTRPDRLASNPLMRSRLVIDVSGPDSVPATLQSLLREAAATLTSNPKDIKLHRSVWHTYFEPTPTQEQAAELLGLPFNTYRYRLAHGIDRITSWLWRRELEGPGA